MIRATETRVRPATSADAERVAEIYNHYILSTVVTFEEQAVSASDVAQRIQEVHSASLPWLVADAEGRVVGDVYSSKWKGRCAYRYSVEASVYLDHTCSGRGIGSTLYGELFPILRAKKMHAVMGGIALPNAASVALHEKFGMKKVAHFSEVGFKFNQWIDVGYWEGKL